MKSDTAVLFTGVVIGFILIPPLARANAVLVNGFLFLILFSSLLLHRDIWLPYFATFGKATSSKPTINAQGGVGTVPYGPPTTKP